MAKGNCIITGEETSHNFDGLPIKKEVLEFARKYRDALEKLSQRQRTVRGILTAFQEMKNGFGYTFERIQEKLIAEMKDKGIDL
jgi:hypothetical protein